MKLIKTLHKLKSKIFMKFPDNNIYLKSALTLSLISLLAASIYWGGAYVSWGEYSFLAQPEKRVYVIIVLYLLWLLKLLVIDLDAPNPFQYRDLPTRKKLEELQQRFNGALRFLKITKTTKQNKLQPLNQLPWYLLIGPQNAGKTTMLANSGVNFILQRQFSNQPGKELRISENCDWWVTRDSSIIDVPGKYLSLPAKKQGPQKTYFILWKFFLRLIKKNRGKNGLDGIIIALPLPELMKQNDSKNYQLMLKELLKSLHDLSTVFSTPLPCKIVITECDLLPGFKEFFAESST